MDQLTPTPRYRLLEDTFFAPDLVEKGSIVETWGPVGPHFEPINATARETMEAWYDEEFTYKVKDPTGGEDLVRTHRPHADLRLSAPGQVAPAKAVKVLAPPVKTNVGNLSLANIGLRPGTDQRPAPEVISEVPEEFREPPVALVEKAPSTSTLTTSRKG